MLTREIVIDEPERPRWYRVATVRRIYSLSTVRVYELLNEGALESVVFRRKGNKRGIRLISVESVERHMQRAATTKMEPLAAVINAEGKSVQGGRRGKRNSLERAQGPQDAEEKEGLQY
jgi:hypothetical protein